MTFRHEAFLYSGATEFLAGTLPFIRDSIADDAPVLVAVNQAMTVRLREELGPQSDRVRFVRMEDAGRNPGRIISVWHDFVTEHRGRRIRGIGEPVWHERTADELVECQQHEHLLNDAFEGAAGFWLRCPYDRAALAPAVLAEASRSHPVVCDVSGASTSADFERVDDLLGRSTDLPAAPDDAWRIDLPPRLATVRSEVRSRALQAGVAPERADDLVLAVAELTANSLQYARGGTLRAWTDRGRFVVEVRDRGAIGDPLVGRRRPHRDAPTGRGLWLVHQVCDLVQVRSTAEGTVVRISFDLAVAPAAALLK